MIAQPAPASQELTDALYTYFDRRRKPTDFEIKSLERKAEALKNKIDFADYYTFLGIIAALRQDSKSLTSHFDNALKLAPNNTVVLSNYLVALNNSGEHLKALILGRTLLKRVNNDDKLLNETIRSACQLCRFHEAHQLLLNNLENDQKSEWYQYANHAIEITDYAHLDDNEAEQLQQLAFSLLKKNNLYFSNIRIGALNDFIHYEIFVDLPIAQIPALDFELSRTFAKNLENMRDDVIVFEYRSVEALQK